MFLLPGNVPHSPRRKEGSWTFVVERKRQASEIDRFIWVCEKCGNRLYETTVRFNDPTDAVAKATAAIQADSKLATCNRCGEVLAL